METELFVHFAEIAGVFIGFGTLISLRSAHLTDPHDVVYHQGVLLAGVWVVIAALVPIAVSRYGVLDHALWLSCALIAIVIWAVMVVTLNHTAGSKEINRSPERVDRLFPVIGLPLHLVIFGSLALVIFAAWPGVDAALYVTALTAGVIFGGYTLLALAFSQNPQPGPDRGGDEAG